MISTIAAITSILVNVYTLYTVRKSIGHIGNQAVQKVEEVIKK